MDHSYWGSVYIGTKSKSDIAPRCVHRESNLRFIYTDRKRTQKRIVFFDPCRCSIWPLNWLIYESIWKRYRFRFRFCINIKEPLPAWLVPHFKRSGPLTGANDNTDWQHVQTVLDDFSRIKVKLPNRCVRWAVVVEEFQTLVAASLQIKRQVLRIGGADHQLCVNAAGK